eukprot:TRINITY_DN2976_c1_g1_i1.p1 TRINITY_DN2976_c1_g1~~TRINITY_DN2976_c1_g1_i1.p1  ORF type:complete len:205 (-),score=35.19 TRINITY_DN2976_c1_g1_i1:333-947(-)
MASGNFAQDKSDWVEVQGQQKDHFGWSWYNGRIINTTRQYITIECKDFIEEDGCRCQEKIRLPTDRVRPTQPYQMCDLTRYSLGDLVDIWVDDVWWEGVVVNTAPEKVFVVLPFYGERDMGPFVVHDCNYIRRGMLWASNCWVPRKQAETVRLGIQKWEQYLQCKEEEEERRRANSENLTKGGSGDNFNEEEHPSSQENCNGNA